LFLHFEANRGRRRKTRCEVVEAVNSKKIAIILPPIISAKLLRRNTVIYQLWNTGVRFTHTPIISDNTKSALKLIPQANTFDNAYKIYSELKTPDKAVLEAMVRICVKFNRNKLEDLWNDFKKHSVPISNYTFQTLVNFCVQSKKAEFAKVLLAELRVNKALHIPTRSFNKLLDVLCKTKTNKTFTTVLQVMDRVSPDEYTFSTLLSACVANANSNDAYLVLERLQNSNTKHSIFLENAILKLFLKTKRFDDAKNTFNSMVTHGPKPDRVTCILMLSYCTNLTELVERYIEENDISMDTKLRTALIKAHAIDRNMPKALSLFADIGTEATDVTFITLLNACAENHDLESGEFVHKAFINSNIPASVEIKNALIKLYFACDLPEKAWNEYRNMIQHGPKPNDVTHELMLNRCIASKNTSQGQEVCRNISRASSTLSDTVLLFHLVSGDTTTCLKLLEQRRRYGPKPTCRTYTMLFGQCNDTDVGDKLIKLLESDKLKTDVMLKNVLLQYYLKYNIEKAISLYNTMENPDHYTFSTLLNGLTTDTGRVPRTIDIDAIVSRALSDHKFRQSAQAMNTLLFVLFKYDKANKAMELYHEMERNSPLPNDITYNIMLGGCADVAALEFGSQIHDHIRKHNIHSKKVYDALLLTMLNVVM
jgi:pentatricopeptide repeat protein